jgi:hypothetical protein
LLWIGIADVFDVVCGYWSVFNLNNVGVVAKGILSLAQIFLEGYLFVI